MCLSILGIKIISIAYKCLLGPELFSVSKSRRLVQDGMLPQITLSLRFINYFAILLTLSDIYVYFLCCDRPSGKLKYTFIDCFRTVNNANNYSISTSQLVADVS